MSDWIDVAHESDLPPGGFKCVEIGDNNVAVINVDGDYFAIDNVCSHDFAMLTDGDIEGDEIICPLHGACFSIRTGEALTPPAYEPVATYSVRVVDGNVQVSREPNEADGG
ncbi:MAG: non-heme iron oxygenase ferredoxin subunit [Gammaproteobacteria bacterium]|nr:non-heme iron oxygenase ferredoxin subunit [Gammaproteobacteria bacterium]